MSPQVTEFRSSPVPLPPTSGPARHPQLERATTRGPPFSSTDLKRPQTAENKVLSRHLISCPGEGALPISQLGFNKQND